MGKELFTIGHSNHPIDRFVKLLQHHHIDVVADVRSAPYSRHNPQFNREVLSDSLKESGLKYVFLGKELGARSNDPRCYVDGKVQYHLLAQTPLFQQGLQRLRTGIASHRVALMCSEKDPITCHRTILVCRQFQNDEVDIKHILANGTVQTRIQVEDRLMWIHQLQPSLLYPIQEIIEQAYDKQAQEIAYVGAPQVNHTMTEKVEAQ